MRVRLAAFSLLFALMIGPASILPAEELEFDFLGPRFNFLLADGIPTPTGADIELRRPLFEARPGGLALTLRLGAGYEDLRIVRDDLSGDPVAAPVEASDPRRFNSPNAQWDLGLVQGLLRNEGGPALEAFVLYRGRYDVYENSLSTTVFPDLHGLLGTALLFGAAYEGVERDSRRLKSGLSAEASFEWGPSFLASSLGPVDYWRANLQAEFYQPLFSSGEGGLNLISAYLAGFGSLDLAGGSTLPIFVMQSFGGRELRKSLGGSVRGYPSRSYDADRKAVGNLELRVLGPALFRLPWFLPLAYGFFDAGYYSGFSAAGPAWEKASGTIASVGGGFAICVVDFAYIGLRAGYLLPGNDGLFPVYLPEEKKDFLSFEFLLHF